MKVRIDYAICNSCGLCREVCPESAIRPACSSRGISTKSSRRNAPAAASVSAIAPRPALWCNTKRGAIADNAG